MLAMLMAMTDAAETTDSSVPSTQSMCFGCGPANTAGLRLEFSTCEDQTVICITQIAPTFDGHPGYVHGGVIATMLDEAMSKALRATGRAGVTSKLEASYLRPVPSATALRIEGRLLRSEHNQHWLEARVMNLRGRTLAEGKGLFVAIKPRT